MNGAQFRNGKSIPISGWMDCHTIKRLGLSVEIVSVSCSGNDKVLQRCRDERCIVHKWEICPRWKLKEISFGKAVRCLYRDRESLIKTAMNDVCRSVVMDSHAYRNGEVFQDEVAGIVIR